MRRITTLLLTSALTLLVGCDSHYTDTALYHSNGKAKPIVAVLPVIDSTDTQVYNWDRSEEFTSEIRKHVAVSPRLYLLNYAGALSLAKELNTPHMDEIPHHVIDNLTPAEFAIVSELIDERVTPCGIKKNPSKLTGDLGSKIQLAMRIRVLDLRGKEPKVVLQEVIYQDQDVASAYESDYTKAPWGSARFPQTPLGMAHNKVVRKLVAHVEGYVGL
jgi:hypothetical protein